MEGNVCIVTGASSGIGKETARALAEMGAHVVMVSRDPQRGEAARADIARTATGPIDVMLADLSVQAQVRALADSLLRRYPRIDVLVNNAGVYRLRRTETVDGIETTFAVNHLAAFLLTNLLRERLAASAPARVVVVASAAHHAATLDLDDLQLRRRYGAWRAYSRSKLANVMFTYALARRLEGTGATANCLHPGFVATNLGSGNIIPSKPIMMLLRPFVRGPREGARDAVFLASSPDVDGVTAGYFVDLRETASSRLSYDEEAQERLWDASAALTGLPVGGEAA